VTTPRAASANAPRYPVPDDESDRLERLRRLDILDTERELPFDDIVELAAAVCDVPVALISFIDTDRQWFKAAHGWDVTSTPRDVALCAHTIVGDHAMVVEDAAIDARFAGNPLVAGEPPIRFYAGVPLRVGIHHGSAVGTLCAIGPEPRRPGRAQLDALSILARQVERILDARVIAADHRRTVARNALLEQRMIAVASSMSCGVVVHARDGAIEANNPAAEDILGMSASQMRGLTPLHPTWACVRADGSDFPGVEHPASIALRDGTEVRDTTMGVRRPDGTTRWILVSATPIPGRDGHDGAVATFVDISREVDLRYQLQESLALLTETMQEHSSLTAAITHDLAAPAAATRIYAELLTTPGDLDPRVVNALRQSAHRTERLIADLGGVANRLRDDRPPQRAPHDLFSVVRRACARSDIAVDVLPDTGDTTAEVDVLQIERIIDNLIDNAMKHGGRDVAIRVGVDGTGGDVTITVDDDGPGIATAHRTDVFQPFRRLDAAADAPGTGIGLYLVQQFALFHGGQARCEESPLGGSRFVVTIARASAAASRPG
jgi:two-component system, sensor histidine kinase